jgi:hypothetical protein
MKKITLSIIAACSFFSAESQVVLTQNFTSPFNPGANGWVTNNLSTAVGTTPTWFQGNAAVFSAFNGGASDYFAANFNNVTGSGDISNWLITPTVTIYNGAVLEFATRTSVGTPAADRLQIRMSTTGGTVFSTGGPTDISSFNTLMLDINPLLVTTAATAVSNGSVNGYPQSWTVYQLTVAGVTGTVSGRFAFRYFVTNGGPTGLNSNFIGLDAVKYTLPCGPTVPNYVVCPNTAATLIATGGLAATGYSWSTGGTTSSISITSPASGSVSYTLTPIVNGLACSNNTQVVTVTTGASLSFTAASSSNTVCSGRTVTLTAGNSAANSYQWLSGTTPIGTGPEVVVTPTVGPNTFVAGTGVGTCLGTINVNVTGLPNPTVGITTTNSVVCVNGASTAVSFTGTGAVTYTFVLLSNGSSAAANPITLNLAPQDATTAAQYSVGLGVVGTGVNGCTAQFIYTLTANRIPTVTAAVSKSVECVNNRTVTLTASSIPSNNSETYSWSGSTVATGSLVNYSTNTTSGPKSFTVVATSGLGCASVPVVRTMTVSLCTGIEILAGSSNVGVYPNPFNQELTVSGVNGHVEIYNALGQLVMSALVNESTTVNTSELTKGIYVLKAFNAAFEVEKTIKLLKN